MSVHELERDVRRIVGEVEGTSSVAISTPGGNIRLNSDVQLSAASLIKIPILLEAFRQAQEGILDLQQVVRVSSGDKVGGMGVLARLSDDLDMCLRDLVTLMIIVSDNTATNLVIDAVGRQNVNDLCRSLGADKTLLDRQMMDLQARQQGRDNFTSADDMVLLLREVNEGSTVQATLREEMLDILLNQQFNHKMPAMLAGGVPGDPVLAHKTGELPNLEHDAGIFSFGDSRAYVTGMFTDLEDNLQGQRALARIGLATVEFLGTL